MNDISNIKILTVKDIQEHLKLSRTMVYRLINQDSFPKIKIGNTYRIPEDKYLKWIEQHTRKNIIL